MIISLFALFFGKLRAYSSKGLGGYFQANVILLEFYAHFLPEFLLCSLELQLTSFLKLDGYMYMCVCVM